MAGDWNGAGIDTIGVFRNGVFYLRLSNTPGPADLVIPFGDPGDLPVVGDFDGSGTDTIGVFRNGTFYLRNTLSTGPADIVFAFGAGGGHPADGPLDGAHRRLGPAPPAGTCAPRPRGSGRGRLIGSGPPPPCAAGSIVGQDRP